MKQLSLLNWIVGAVGVAIIILCFFIFLTGLPDNIFWLDLVVVILAYSLIYFRAVQPMVRLDNRSQREVPIIGLSFTAIGLYTLAVVLSMVIMQLSDVEFKYQLLAQIILAFLLLLTFMAGARISNNTVEVFNAEQTMTSELDSLRRQVRLLDRSLASATGIPDTVKSRIAGLASQLRYMSPCNKLEATDLEREMIAKLTRIESLCSDYEANATAIDRTLDEITHIAAERRSIFSE